MKHNMKAYLKYGIFLLGIVFLLPQCQKEDVAIDTEIAQEKRIKRISLDNLTSKIGNTTSYRELSAIFDVNKRMSASDTEDLSATSDVWIDTDEIVMIQNNDITYYTFILETNALGNQFYNLVADVDNQGTIQGMQILEYTPNSTWLVDTSEPFTGTVKLIQNNFYTTADIATLLQAEVIGSECVTGLDYQWECDAGNEHPPGDPECTVGGAEFIIFPTYGPCPASLDPGTSGGGGNNSTPVNPSSGGGNNGSGVPTTTPNGNATATTPLTKAEYLQISQELDSIVEEGDSWEIKDDIDPNAPSFDTIEELEAYVNGFNNISLTTNEQTDISQPNTVTAEFSCNVRIDWGVTLDVEIVQRLGDDVQNFTDYSVEGITSSFSGFTFMTHWQQDSYSTYMDAYMMVARLKGRYQFTLFYQGVGVIYEKKYVYILTTNATDGSPISWDNGN